MSRHRFTVTSFARRLRPTPEDFAAAAALHDPSLLLQLQAAQPHRERSIRPEPPRHRHGGPSSIRLALRGTALSARVGFTVLPCPAR